MKVSNGGWRYSSRDLFKVGCKHCTLLEMAVAAGVPEALAIHEEYKVDLSQVLPVRQGIEYEAMVFSWLNKALQENFVELDRPTASETLEILRAGVPVVAQGYFETTNDGIMWSGYADLLVREDFDVISTENGQIEVVHSGRLIDAPRYVVWDVKCSKNIKDYYWMQVASYAAVLQQHGLASSEPLGIIGVQGLTLRKGLDESFAALNEARSSLLESLQKHTPASISFADVTQLHCSSTSVCDDIHCPYPGHCEFEILAEDPLSQIYRFATASTPLYEAAGVKTLHELASVSGDFEVPGVKTETLAKHREWARIIDAENSAGEPKFDVLDVRSWKAIPAESPNDLFFDIEWFNPVNATSPFVFMFGAVSASEVFECFDSHELQDEEKLFHDFVKYASHVMESDADGHIYHYHDPEPKHLLRLAEKHGILHDEVKFLVSRMVDLKPVAMSRVRPGAGGYSIKQLERYYDADTKLRRDGLVKGGDDAMLYFDNALKAETEVDANKHMDIIRSYNRDDCLSTKLLRDWLSNIL